MIQPYIRTLHEFEQKSLFFSYFCAAAHVLVKKLFKEKKTPVRSFDFLKTLLKNSAMRQFEN